MPIRVKCGGCKKTLSVKDHLAGKKIKCPVCQTVVAVPTSSTVPKAPPSAAPTAKPASPPAAKNPAAPKPGIVTKPPPDKAKSNGTPAPADSATSNGTPAPIELPPESVEAEALAAFADQPKPAEENAEPQFIDFKCDWCDEQVKLPIELAGKQAPCPNPECKRIIKVPLPKKVEKKDWRKMDRQGPAAARINQPEQLADAWGTENTTRARQDSLVKAGAIDEPTTKRPRDIFDRLRVGFVVLAFAGLLVAVIFVGIKLYSTKQHHNALKEVETLAVGNDAKIKQPLLLAEAHRAIGFLYLREGKAVKARQNFQGAQAYIAAELAKSKNAGVNEPLFLCELALAQIELGGEGDEILGNTKTKLDWETVRGDLAGTLDKEKLRDPEAQTMAMREVGTRLFAKKQPGLAVGLAASLSNEGAGGRRPPAFRQQIALLCAMDQEEKLKAIAPKPSGKDAPDAHARVGYAEGCARKADPDFAAALALAQLPGLPKDKLDAYLGVAAVALQLRNKDEAVKFFKEALSLASQKDVKASDWQKLQLIRLAARTDEPDSVKDIIKGIEKQPFKLRAHLEIFLAVCEKSTGEVPVDALQDLEKIDKEDGTTLALAWLALAQQNARNGQSRDHNRAIFEERILVFGPTDEVKEKIRPLVDIGSYLGAGK